MLTQPKVPVDAVRTIVVSLAILATGSLPLWALEPASPFRDTLSGILSADIKAIPCPYLVLGDVYVPPGATVTIPKGTILLFGSFAGLHVQGTLLAQGTLDDPIVFSSKHDAAWNSSAPVNAAPFDWNGIDIDEGSIGTTLSECVVRYSVYGIRSQTQQFSLKNVHFVYNGRANLTIKGEQRTIDAQPYSYRSATLANTLPVPNSPAVTQAFTARANTPVSSERAARSAVSAVSSKSSGLRTTIRVAGLGLAVAGCASGSWALTDYPRAQKRFYQVNTRDSAGVLSYTSADWDTAKKIRDRDLAVLLIGWGAAVIGIAGLVVTFTF